MSNYLRLKKMLYIVSLAAVSIVIGLIEIPNPFSFFGPWAAFVRLDFSDVVILVSLVVLGPKETLFVILLRSGIRPLILPKFGPAMDYVGEFLAVMASVSLIIAYLTARKILKKKEQPLLYVLPIQEDRLTKKDWAIYLGLSILILSTGMLLANYLFATPLYLSMFGATQSTASLHFTVFSYVKDSVPPFTLFSFLIAAIISYVPFNIMKSVFIMSIFLVLKPKLKYLEL
ncbi:MAG: hypothetical protein KKG64_05110 [Firmicutes bacterium]|nr:hypothetical protein [Bacillota bacterium]